MRLFSFRLDNSLKDRLNLLKKYYNSDLTISDVVRNLLERSVANAIHNLEKFPPDLKIIARKVETEQPLNHEEIEYLGIHAHQAYLRVSTKQEVINSRYLLDNLSAFEALFKITKFPKPEWRYFLDNLAYEAADRKNIVSGPREALQIQLEKRLDENNFFDSIEENKKNINKIVAGTAEFMSRNLHGLVTDPKFLQADIHLANQVIDPYKRSLVILAKKYFLIEKGYPVLHYLDRPLLNRQLFVTETRKPNDLYYPELMKGKHTYLFYSYDLKFNGHFGLGNELETRAGISFNFPVINDLIKVCKVFTGQERWEKRKGEFFTLHRPPQYQGNIVAIYYKEDTRINLNDEEFEDLKMLLLQMEKENQLAFNELCYQWGDI